MAARKQLLFEDLKFELGLTRKVLERLPEQHFAWTPHEKSMHLGQLAAHVANVVNWFTMGITMDGLDLAAFPRPDRRGPTTSAELLSTFDDNVAKAKTALTQLTDDALDETWTLRMGDRSSRLCRGVPYSALCR